MAQKRFDAVRVGHAPDIFPGAMVHSLMVEGHAEIGAGLIGVYRRPRRGVLRDEALERRAFRVLDSSAR